MPLFTLRTILGGLLLAAGVHVHAVQVLIDFETETPGPVAGGQLIVNDVVLRSSDQYMNIFSQTTLTGTQADGNSLFLFDPTGPMLRIGPAGVSQPGGPFEMDYLSILVGDDHRPQPAGERFWLLAYRNAKLVGGTFVVGNFNALFDQRVTFTGAVFDEAFFFMGDAMGARIPNEEFAVDNIVVNVLSPVPEPGSFALMIGGALALARWTQRARGRGLQARERGGGAGAAASA